VVWDNEDFSMPLPVAGAKKSSSRSDLLRLARQASSFEGRVPISDVDPKVIDRVESIVMKIASRGEPFTTDLVWYELGEDDGFSDRRHLGSIMLRLAKRNLIKKTGYAVQSERRSGAPVNQWVIVGSD